MNDSIEKDQEKFFNLNATKQFRKPTIDVFLNYVNKEQYYSYRVLKDCVNILDFGVGLGNCIEMFLEVNKDSQVNYHFYGVDIAEKAIEVVTQKYPNYDFYKIANNQMPQIKDSFLDACYMMHVLHHSKVHLDIFEEIYRKLNVGGYFVINDLSSNNFIIKLGRFLFPFTPKFVKKKFDDDLVVEDMIPEKYKVDIDEIIELLKIVGFTIKEVGYGHLFFFVFVWIEKFIPFSKSKLISFLFDKLMVLEKKILEFNFFKRRAELFYIICRK